MSGSPRYQRAYRERQREGLAVLHVTVDLVAWVEALIAARMLQPADYDNRPAIEVATARVLELLPELDRLNGLR
jgi:hypothetical protein